MPGQPHVLNIGGSAGDLGGNIDARHRLAHDRDTSAGSFSFDFGCACTCSISAGDQIAVAEPPAVGCDHRAVLGREALGRQIEPPRRFRDQELAHLRGRVRIAVPLSCIEWLPAV